MGDVLAGAPVAAGERAGEAAALVEEVDRQAVDLQLAEEPVCRAAGPPGVPLHPRGPGRQLLGREGVVEAEHPLEVVNRLELGRETRRSHLLGRAVRRPQAGVGLLQGREIADERVVLPVGHGRGILDVIGELVGSDRFGQLGPGMPDLGWHVGGARGRFGAGHGVILPHRADNPLDGRRRALDGGVRSLSLGSG